MTIPRTMLIAVMLVALLLVGCGGDPDVADTTTILPETTTAAPTSTLAPTSTTDSTPDSTVVDTTQPTDDGTGTGEALITEADDGGQVTGTVGEQVLLQLSSEWSWEQPQVEGGVVLTPVDYLVDPGYMEWIVELTDAGDAQITTAGAPNCADPSACPDRTVTFTVTVEG